MIFSLASMSRMSHLRHLSDRPKLRYEMSESCQELATLVPSGAFVWCSAVQLALEADFLNPCFLKDHGGGMINTTVIYYYIKI